MNERRDLWWSLPTLVGLAAAVLATSAPFAAEAATPAATLCFGRTATISGTGADDVLRGTAGDDVIVGGAGNDRIDGAGGNDVLCGGDGEDALLAGAGVGNQLDSGPATTG